MPHPSAITPAEKLAEKNKPSSSLTPERLSELACLLSKSETDEPSALVKRALAIWNAANEELSGCDRVEAHEAISFDVIAENKMLPSIREKTGFVETGKGVGKAVERYFETLINCYDKAMKGRRIDSKLLRTNKQKLERLRDAIVTDGRLPKHILDLLKEFQLHMRKGSHTVYAQEIREVLGGADIGLPSTGL